MRLTSKVLSPSREPCRRSEACGRERASRRAMRVRLCRILGISSGCRSENSGVLDRSRESSEIEDIHPLL